MKEYQLASRIYEIVRDHEPHGIRTGPIRREMHPRPVSITRLLAGMVRDKSLWRQGAWVKYRIYNAELVYCEGI